MKQDPILTVPVGRGVAFEYARLGATIIILDILDDTLSATASEARKLGYNVYPFVCDVSSNTAVEELGAKIIKEIGLPDILYNNAVVMPHTSIKNMDIVAIRYGLDVSVLGYLRIVKAFVNEMIALKSGWIVNTSSPNGVTPAAKFAHFGLPYNLCKAADMSMS
jgi:NADP-dependent 3-hydroxy acid dehydrogenase YdfG